MKCPREYELKMESQNRDLEDSENEEEIETDEETGD